MRKRKHLRRLDQIFVRHQVPLYYVTCCVADRRRMLTNPLVAGILTEAWQVSSEVRKWLVGRYVIMPDHVHFFACPYGDDAPTLSRFMASWKHWTGNQIRARAVIDFAWQREFFDHLLRDEESYEQKWLYVRDNPVRAKLVSVSNGWPYTGEINILRW